MAYKDPEAKRRYAAAWYAANREKEAARKAAWVAANREKVAARKAAWYVENKGKMAASYAANREKKIAYNRAYRAANREKIAAQRVANKKKTAAQAAAYRAANREKLAEYRAKNRLRIAAKEVERKYGLTPEDVALLDTVQNGACGACGVPLKVIGQNVDHCHDTGRVRGLLCPPCNQLEGRLRAASALEYAPAGLKAYLENPPALALELV